MDLQLVLGLIKVGLEVYQGATRDKYLKKYLKIQKDFQDELNKGINDRSDLELDRLRIDARQLAELLIRESNRGK
jgi:hypothetical protein